MKLRSLLTALAILISSITLTIPASVAATTCALGGTCVIGDTGPGGGKVFFVKATGSFSKSRTVTGFMGDQTFSLSLTSDQQAALPFDYLEVAPTQSSSFRWGSNGSITGGTSTLIGSGAANTANIIASFPSDTAANNAAHYANSYSNNSKSDWYLPSYDELLLINIVSLESDSGGPNIGSFPDGHWASTSTDNSNARYSARGQLSGYVVKASTANSRAIRSFSRTVFEGVVDNEAIRREAEGKRQEAIRNAQAEIVRKVKAQIHIVKADLQAAEAPLIQEPFLALANKDFRTLDSAIDYPRINKIITKYRIYDQIAGNLPGFIKTSDLINYGLIDSSTPMKQLTTYRLLKMPLAERDSIEEIDAYYKESSATFIARKERLASIITKIQNQL